MLLYNVVWSNILFFLTFIIVLIRAVKWMMSACELNRVIWFIYPAQIPGASTTGPSVDTLTGTHSVVAKVTMHKVGGPDYIFWVDMKLLMSFKK